MIDIPTGDSIKTGKRAQEESKSDLRQKADESKDTDEKWRDVEYGEQKVQENRNMDRDVLEKDILDVKVVSLNVTMNKLTTLFNINCLYSWLSSKQSSIDLQSME